MVLGTVVSNSIPWIDRVTTWSLPHVIALNKVITTHNLSETAIDADHARPLWHHPN